MGDALEKLVAEPTAPCHCVVLHLVCLRHLGEEEHHTQSVVKITHCIDGCGVPLLDQVVNLQCWSRLRTRAEQESVWSGRDWTSE
jgi:hypothetical protein